MATTLTSIGPIGARQINGNLYVGHNDLTTIQSAVSVAVKSGSILTVYIPPEYAGSDTIAAVTGGSASVLIVDQRHGQRQTYTWSGTAYTPLGLTIMGYVAPQVGALQLLSGQGIGYLIGCGPDTAHNGELQFRVCASDGTNEENVLQLLGTGDGHFYNNLIVDKSLTVGAGIAAQGFATPQADALLLQNGGGVSYMLGCGPDITHNGELMFRVCASDGTNPQDVLQLLGTGDGHFYNDLIVDGNITSENSPVRTFANTPDSPDAPTYPPPGIGVSTGTAWSATSIAPSSLAYVGSKNTFTVDQNFMGDLYVAKTLSVGPYGSSNNVQVILDANGNADGSGKALRLLSINPSSTTLIGAMSLGGYSADLSVVDTYLNCVHTSANGIQVSVGGSLYVPTTLSVGPYGSSNNVQIILDANGNADGSGKAARLLSNNPTSTALIGALSLGGYSSDLSVVDTYINCVHTSANGIQVSVGGSLSVSSGLTASGTATVGAGHIRIGDRATGGNWNSGSASLSADATNLLINPGPTGGVYFNWDQGTAGVNFGGGAGSAVAKIDNIGNLILYNTLGNLQLSGSYSGQLGPGVASIRGGGGSTNTGLSLSPGQTNEAMNFGIDAKFNTGQTGNYNFWSGPNSGGTNSIVAHIDRAGNITGATKNFRITHPLDETLNLTHSCLEGPEIAVFYRGEGVTSNGGWIEITLPGYFEALTMKENRTVQITPFFENDDEPISTVAASRVKNGKFKVWSESPAQKFYWEVKAVRADVEPLKIVTSKEAA